MDLERNPPLLEHLASAYALGTLRGGARRRFQALARRSPRVRAAALLWQERLQALTEVESVAPSPEVWKRIVNMLPPASAPPLQEPLATRAAEAALRLWRSLAGGAAVAAVVIASVGWNVWTESNQRAEALAQARAQAGELAARNQQLLAQAQAQPEIRYVSVLSDERSAAFLLAMYDPKHSTLTLQRVGSYAEAPDRSLELWALPQGAAPQSLGVLDAGGIVRLPAAEQQLGRVPALAVTLEPRGGVPAGSGPTGPVLFKGALLRTPT
ncbi:MAG: anti-sigma factor [Pseudomonadota bacterium]